MVAFPTSPRVLNEKPLSRRQAAEVLGLHPQTVLKYMRLGFLEACQAGRARNSKLITSLEACRRFVERTSAADQAAKGKPMKREQRKRQHEDREALEVMGVMRRRKADETEGPQ